MPTTLHDYESGNDLQAETDAEFFGRLDTQDQAERARIEAIYPIEPTTEDWADYNQWSQSIHDHQMALNVWLTFFPDEERSTFYES